MDWPETLTFEYQGRQHTMELIREMGVPCGYVLWCPGCGRSAILAFDQHQVTIEGGKPTVHPSIVCPYGCGWHVWLKQGVAQCAGR